MNRKMLHTLGAAGVVAVNALLLVLALHHHGQYVSAHESQTEALKGVSNPLTASLALPEAPPEEHLRKARRVTYLACGLVIVPLIVGFATRHRAWVACAIVCALLAVIALVKATGAV